MKETSLKGTPRLVITGFMGAGKTTVARELARLAGRAALDLDDLITAREGRTPQELIDQEGEAAFRDAETRALAEALEQHAAHFIATGGGAFTLPRNRALINDHDCLTVWLDAPFDLCWQRIHHATHHDAHPQRPFARDQSRARRLYDDRRSSYELADLHVRVTPEKSVEDIAAEILEVLGHARADA